MNLQQIYMLWNICFFIAETGFVQKLFNKSKLKSSVVWLEWVWDGVFWRETNYFDCYLTKKKREKKKTTFPCRFTLVTKRQKQKRRFFMQFFLLLLFFFALPRKKKKSQEKEKKMRKDEQPKINVLKINRRRKGNSKVQHIWLSQQFRQYAMLFGCFFDHLNCWMPYTENWL